MTASKMSKSELSEDSGSCVGTSDDGNVLRGAIDPIANNQALLRSSAWDSFDPRPRWPSKRLGEHETQRVKGLVDSGRRPQRATAKE